MKTKSSLVGSDRRIHLNTVSAVDLNFFLIIDPSDAKGNHPFGFYHTQQNILTVVNIVLYNVGNHCFSNLGNGLHKLRFVLIFLTDLG